MADQAYVFLPHDATDVPPAVTARIQDKLAGQESAYAVTTGVAIGLSVAALVGIALSTWLRAPFRPWEQLAVFVAVALVPVAVVGWVAALVVKLGRELWAGDHTPGFSNPGAFLGILERVLFLGSMVGGYPEFIAVWFVYKGIEGWQRTSGQAVRSGRLFQLALVNNAVSLAFVGLAWVVWNLLGLPVHRR